MNAAGEKGRYVRIHVEFLCVFAFQCTIQHYLQAIVLFYYGDPASFTYFSLSLSRPLQNDNREPRKE